MAASFAQAQFGKPLDQITADDLRTYFSTERDESLTLEFKSFYQKEGDIKHKENGVLRTICAFLNATGGLVIWGAPIGTKNAEGEKVFVGDLSPVERRYSKDDFISKVSNRIVLLAAGIQFHSVEVEDNKFVYLIDVPESTTKPHQFDNIYYIRLDGQTKIAPHYLVDAMFKQVRRPELEGYMRVTSWKFVRGEGLDSSGRSAPNYYILRMQILIVNVTPTINDTDVYFHLTSRLGTLTSGVREVSNGDDEHEINFPNAAPIISFSLPVERTITYRVKSSAIHNLVDPTDFIVLSFGGTSSATKLSKYTIRFNDRNLTFSPSERETRFTAPIDLNNLLKIEKEENVDGVQEWAGNQAERIQKLLKGI